MNVHNQIDRFLNKNSSEKYASWRNYLKIVRTTLAHAQCSCAATAALRSFRPVRSLVVWGGKGGEEDDHSAVECVEFWAWQEMQTTITFWNVSRSEEWQTKKTTVTEGNVSRCEVWQTKKTTITEFGCLILVRNGVKVIGIFEISKQWWKSVWVIKFMDFFSSIFVILIICWFFSKLLPKLMEFMKENSSKFFPTWLFRTKIMGPNKNLVNLTFDHSSNCD
jgi:hypothetical protein